MPRTASRPFNVLVIDDEPDVRDLLVEYFRDRGHEVTVRLRRARGRRGNQTAPVPSMGSLSATCNCPGVDGLGVLKAAKAANPSATVIIVTGYASVDQPSAPFASAPMTT